MDALSAVFLGCFVFGFVALLGWLLLGGLHDLHLGGHHVDLGLDHGHAAGLDAPADVGTLAGPQGADSGPSHVGALPLGSLLSPTTVLTFLTWFGGAGFILRNYYGVVAVASLAAAAVVGLAAAAVVVVLLLKVLLPHQTVMRQADYDPVGSVGRISVPVRPGGIGEVVYTRGGTRRSAGARSLDGRALAQGTEVVIAKYEHGVAYVQPWAEFVSRERRSAAEGNG